MKVDPQLEALENEAQESHDHLEGLLRELQDARKMLKKKAHDRHSGNGKGKVSIPSRTCPDPSAA